MNNFKFRAWDITYQEMLEVDVINFANEEIEVTRDYDEVIDFEDIALMQLTELKDKNGTKIYEGDIVKIDGLPKTHTFQKVVREKTGIYKVESNNGHRLNFFSWENWEGHIEVVGNIYENSELLEDDI